MKKSKASTRSSKKSKQDSNDYRQRIQNCKQDIDKIKTQVSQLQQKLDEQTDYDSTIDLTDDFLQDKYPTKTSKDIKPFSYEQHITRKGKEKFAKKRQGEAFENDDFKKENANIKTKNYQKRQISPITSIDHPKKKHEDKKNGIETPSLENYNQILTDNKVLAHKIKNLLVSNSNLDEENKSLKEMNENLNQQNIDLNEQLTNTKAKLTKLEKLTKELKAKANPQNTNKKSSSSKRSKSVNKIPVMIDPNQIKEKVNSRDFDVDKMVLLEDEAAEHDKNTQESDNNSDNLEKENKKLKEKISNLSDEHKQIVKDFKNKINQLTAENNELKDQLENPPKQLVGTSSSKKLREADSIIIADLTDKIALLEEENRKLRTKGLSATSINIENQDLKKQLNKKQRSRPTDNEAIANLTEKISDLTQENMNLKRSLISSRSLRTENDELKEKIEKLQNEKSKEIKSLSDSNLSENSLTDDIQEKVAILTKENNELKSQINTTKSLERENQKLQNKYNSLVEAIQKTKPDQTAKKQIEKLKATIETLSKENNDHKSSSLSPAHTTCRSVNFKENEAEGGSENEIKRLNEELSSSKEAIDRMEKEFALQKRELKENYDNLLKEITNDFQNKQNPKENQLNKKIKMLEQDLDNQKRLYKSLENVNLKLQDQIAQSRANNFALIKQIEEMNKQIEQLNGNTSSFQFSDQSDQEKNKKNNEYDQIKTDFVQIRKALNEVPDSSDSYSSKLNKFKFPSSQASSSSSKPTNSQKETIEPKKQIEDRNSNSPSNSKRNNYQESPNKKINYPYHPLNDNDDNDIADDDDEGMDSFLDDNKEIILSDNGNDTDNDDINVFLNDNFTESDTESENKTTNNNKNSTLNDSNNIDNRKVKVSSNTSPINNKSPKKKKSIGSPVDLDALLDTSGADFNGAFTTSEAFRQLVESIDQSKGEILMNTEEEYEKLKATLSLEDSLSLDEKSKSKEKSPKKGKKIDHLHPDEDLDDDKTFSD